MLFVKLTCHCFYFYCILFHKLTSLLSRFWRVIVRWLRANSFLSRALLRSPKPSPELRPRFWFGGRSNTESSQFRNRPKKSDSKKISTWGIFIFAWYIQDLYAKNVFEKNVIFRYSRCWSLFRVMLSFQTRLFLIC